MRVEITLKTGVTVAVEATRFECKKTAYSNQVTGFSWGYKPEVGVPYLEFIRVDNVDAVVCYPDSSDLPNGQRGQDERDGEEAQPGGDQVEPG